MWIPSEIILCILENLIFDEKSLCRYAQTCRRNRDIVYNSDCIWKRSVDQWIYRVYYDMSLITYVELQAIIGQSDKRTMEIYKQLLLYEYESVSSMVLYPTWCYSMIRKLKQ